MDYVDPSSLKHAGQAEREGEHLQAGSAHAGSQYDHKLSSCKAHTVKRPVLNAAHPAAAALLDWSDGLKLKIQSLPCIADDMADQLPDERMQAEDPAAHRHQQVRSMAPVAGKHDQQQMHFCNAVLYWRLKSLCAPDRSGYQRQPARPHAPGRSSAALHKNHGSWPGRLLCQPLTCDAAWRMGGSFQTPPAASERCRCGA